MEGQSEATRRHAFNTGGIINSTWKGDQTGAARFRAFLRRIERENIAQNVLDRGEQFMTRLRGMEVTYPFLAKTRGRGLMNAVSIRFDNDPKGERAAKAVKRLIAICQDELQSRVGLHLLKTDHPATGIRFRLPLDITREQIAWVTDLFEEGVGKLQDEIGRGLI